MEATAIKQTVKKDRNNVYASAVRINYIKKSNSIVRIVLGIDKNFNILPFLVHKKDTDTFIPLQQEAIRRNCAGNFVKCLQEVVKDQETIYQYLQPIYCFAVVDCKCSKGQFCKRADGSYIADIAYFVCRSQTTTIDKQEVWNLGRVTLTPQYASQYSSKLIKKMVDIATVLKV